MVLLSTVARIELGVDVREIEALIDTGQQGEASARLNAAHATIGRRPEYRYLRCLYDSAFRVRSDRDLLAEMRDLATEQPDMLEATALLALLYSRAGDDTRAKLFAQLAIESKNPATRNRAMRALGIEPGAEPAAPAPPSSTSAPLTPRKTTSLPPPPPGPGSAVPAPAAGPIAPTEVDEWFVKARRDLVYRRTPTYGVVAIESTAETLLDWGKAVAGGATDLCPSPLPLCRASLEKLDEIIVSARRSMGGGSAFKADTSRVTAIAGFFTAVVLHELGAAVYETAAADGGCKLVLPTGAGTRPLQAATAAAEGTGASLTQLYDRLAASRDLGNPGAKHGSVPPSAAVPRMSWRPLAASKAPASAPQPSLGGLYAMLDTLAMTRPEVEASTVRRIDKPRGPANAPALDLRQVSASFADSPLGQQIANLSGARLSPTPRTVEALESYCSATYGDGGLAANERGWQPSAEQEDLILSWGAFLGETLIATYGGIWECDTNNPTDPRLFRVICQEHVVSWPITRAYMRLKAGAAFNMADLIAEVATLLAEH
jgi:hypothetical protein